MNNEKELNALCSKWQKRLGLQNWNISIKFGIPEQDCLAEIIKHHNSTTALITIRSQDYPIPNTLINQDIEHSIIHELLHLHFLIRESAGWHESVMTEQSINSITNALLSLANALEK